MMKVAYSGIEGAFAHTAARRMFPEAIYVSYDNFTAAYNAVLNKECDRAVLPVENSYAGPVHAVNKLLSEGSLCVESEYVLLIVQNLLGMRGSRIEDIKKVISQPKALEQCDRFLKDKGYELIPAENTAVAAKQVAMGHDMSAAAVASLETAAIYGLKVLYEHINELDDNRTRFVAVRREKEPTEK